MSYYDDNANLDCYFDDDSSVEEELLRVTEKLEAMRQQENEEAKEKRKKTKKEKEDKEEAIVTNRRCPESNSSGCKTTDSLLIVPDTIEIHGGATVSSHHSTPINININNNNNNNNNAERDGDSDNNSNNNNAHLNRNNRTSFRYNDNDYTVKSCTVSRNRKDDCEEDDTHKDKDNDYKYQQTRKDQKNKIQKQQSQQITNASDVTCLAPINKNENENVTKHSSLRKSNLLDDDDDVNDVDSGIINKIVSVKRTADGNNNNNNNNNYNDDDNDEVIVNLATINTAITTTRSSSESDSSSSSSSETTTSGTDLSDDSSSSSSTTSSSSRDCTVTAATGIHCGARSSELILKQSEIQPAATATATATAIPTESSGVIHNSDNVSKTGGDGDKSMVLSGTSRPRVTPPLRNPYLRKKDATIAEKNEVNSTSIDQRIGTAKKITKENTEFSDSNINGNQTQEPSRKTSSGGRKATSAATATAMIEQQGRIRVAEHEERISVDRRGQDQESESEISPSLYAPSACQEGRPTPVVNRFNCRNRPSHSRQTISVQSSNNIFHSSIVNSLWTKKFDRFNHFQSEMFNSLSHSDDNVVVSAPTGAGKSTLFDMAVARFITMDLKAQAQQHASTSTSSQSSFVSKARKIIYVAPSKALCEERYEDWSRRLRDANLGLEIALITGQGENDSGASSFPDLIAAHLIVTTPEKLDSMTRRWNENFFLFASVKLLLLDEVHLLGDESRGWCLESVVTRMKTIHRAARALDATLDEISTSSYPETNLEAVQSCFRMVAVSATLPNISEVADFLQANEAFAFDDSYRPVPLTKHVNCLGRIGNNEWKFWSNLFASTPEIIQRFSHGKQSLIFCHSKKETQKITELLIEKGFGNKGARKLVDPPWSVSVPVVTPVQYMVNHGIGYHNAGMSKDDRKCIEDAFIDGRIRCLAATSTLAVGVNLPAHLVIVVGTKAYRSNEKGKGYQDIEASSLMQMIGRAGRPGLDSTGVAVVLTDNNSKKRIENLLDTGFGPAKSSLCARLPEVMNTEISQQVVTSTVGALRWLQTTFLYSCMKQNEKDPVASAQALSNDAVQYLKDIGIVEVEDQNSIRALVGSHIMNRHSVPFETMKAITAFPFDVSQCQILRSISKLETLHSFVRRNERVELKEFHKTELMKYKLPGPLSKFTVKDPSEKAFILLQSSISRHKFKNEMLNSVHDIVVNEGIKFLQAAQEYSVKASKHGKVALECHKLHRSLHLSLWGESSGVFNQIGWIGGESTIEKTNDLIFNGIRSFQDALDSSEEKLSKILCKHYTLQQNPGRELKKEALIFSRDRLRLFAELVYTRNSNTPVELICTLIYNDPSRAMTKKDGEQSITFSLIAYTDNSVDSKLMFEENISSPSTFSATLPSNSFSKIFITLMGSTIGLDETKVLDVNGGLLPPNRTSDRQLKISDTTTPEIDVRSCAKMKKRKIRQTEVPYTNQRQSKKSHQTKANPSKDPSPITPPQLPLETFGKKSAPPKIGDCDIRTDERRSFRQPKLTPPDQFESFALRHAGGLPVSSPPVNITPTTRLHRRNILPNGRGSQTQTQNMTIQGAYGRNEEPPIHVDLTFTNAVAKPMNSEWSGFENSLNHNPSSQDVLAGGGGGDHQFHREESYTTTLAQENVNVNAEVSTWNASASVGHTDMSYNVTENDMIARRDTRPSTHVDEHSTPSTVRPRNLEAVWKQSQRKQHRTQKRAFTEKKMNPFNSFSHDPNDSEKMLEQLAHQQTSIIPTPLLAKMKQSSVTNSGARHFSNSQRRTKTARNRRHATQNHQEVLREKAVEQQFYKNQQMLMMTQQQYGANQNHHCYQEQRPPMQHSRDQSYMFQQPQHLPRDHFDEYHPNSRHLPNAAPAPEWSTPRSRGYPREQLHQPQYLPHSPVPNAGYLPSEAPEWNTPRSRGYPREVEVQFPIREDHTSPSEYAHSQPQQTNFGEDQSSFHAFF